MRIVCILYFSTILFGILKTAAGNISGSESKDDGKVVEYNGNEDTEDERPNRKEGIKGLKNFVGTNLVGEAGYGKKCFSAEDIALLAARRDFESLIPKDLPNCLLDDDLAGILMQYFYGANQVIEKMTAGHTKIVAQKAFYDTLGGYLKYYMIPISRYSYYAGLVKLRTVENILELYSQCKESLNTIGNGWRAPITDFTDLEIQIEPLRVVVNNEDDTSCTQLELLDERNPEEDDMLVSLPRLDPLDRGLLGNIWLPFKRKRTFNLQSETSAFVLLRYFELTTRCYNFQGISQHSFSKKLKTWILENLEIHFGDDILYPGLGAVQRIVETIRRKTKTIVIPAANKNAKRQKTTNFKSLDNKANQLKTHSDGWLMNVFGVKNPGLLDDYLEDTYIQKEKDCRMKYIYIAIGVSVVILMIVFFGIVITLCKKFKGKPSKSWFWKKPRDDEEVLLDSKSSSIASTRKSKLSKSSKIKKGSKDSLSNTSPPKTTKCFDLCGSKNKPAIIETSSMDSESGGEKGKKFKSEMDMPAKSNISKIATVDERKRVTIPKKYKPRVVAEREMPGRGSGIFKKGN